ncbi:hypothetical protein [Leptolyngbya sp. FACHB-16]|nr:hypothetical protein [Leptolyngbya sp. FACHB-16]
MTDHQGYLMLVAPLAHGGKPPLGIERATAPLYLLQGITPHHSI